MKYPLAKLRREYDSESDHDPLSVDPFTQFSRWFQEAVVCDEEPNAMVLATVSPLGHPSSRSVLLKHFDKKGFCFFTNTQSRKAEQLDGNPYASVTFLWKDLHKQVHIEGKVVRLSRKAVEAYFQMRPKGAQIATYASLQSTPLSSREELEERFSLFQKQFRGKKIPCPKNWGGYRIVPHRFEFWQGRKNRLHERFLYVFVEKKWIMSRLFP